MIFKKALLGATFITAMSLSSNQAHAGAGYDYADAMMHEVAVIGEVASSKAAVIAEELATRLQLTEEINFMSSLLFWGQEQQSMQASADAEKQLASDAALATATANDQRVLEYDKAQYQATVDAQQPESAINQCISSAGGGGSESAARAKSIASSKIDIDYSNLDPAKTASVKLSKHCTFASEYDVKTGLCTAPVGANMVIPGTSTTIENADISIAKNGLSGIGTISSSDPRAEATSLWIANAVNQKSLGELPKNAGKTTEGLNYLHKRNEEIAKLSSATDFFNNMKSRRVIEGEGVSGVSSSGTVMTGKEMVAYAKEQAGKIAGYNMESFNKVGGGEIEGLSWMQWMDINAKSRYFDPEWPSTLTDPVIAAKESALMQSQMLYLQWQQYQMLEQIGSMLALELADRVDENKPQ